VISRFSCSALLVGALSSGFAQAPPGPEEHNATDLAKTTQNPVGDIVSVPLQFNFNTGGPLKDQTIFNLNFQPVIPIHISKSVTLISRTIVPLDSYPGPNGTRYSGNGDIQEQTFLTPARPGKVIWGIGPAFSLPVATALPVQTGTWAAGGSAVVLAMPGPFVLGSLSPSSRPFPTPMGRRARTFFSGNTSSTTTSAKVGRSPQRPPSRRTGTHRAGSSGQFLSAWESAARWCLTVNQ
jgi:hypothetical protein